MVEYAIEGISKPLGVSKFHLTKAIPKELSEQLPDLQEFARRLKDEEKANPMRDAS